jgi:hypothetical protein
MTTQSSDSMLSEPNGVVKDVLFICPEKSFGYFQT